jgi:Glycosyl hydrolase family 99
MIRRPGSSHPLLNRTLMFSLLMTLILLMVAFPRQASATSASAAQADSVPVLAYYYLWFTPSSWNRAKTDLPVLGPYSSDDPDVMRQQIKWAKSAGIDGFIVSWKNVSDWTPRLKQLVEIAGEESFKLAINYESLDFYRNPLPVDQVATDLNYFSQTYAQNPVFDLFGKPVVIWAGTWKYDRSEIAQVTAPLRNDLQILGSEKQATTYENIADLVDGDAYYWSSVDPSTFPDYPGKLQKMADAVHANGGMWIAPAAPGFDARLVGGSKAVDRQDGAVYKTELTTAMSADPDAIGIISWNEFSENSHIEPSCAFDTTYLSITASVFGGTSPTSIPGCNQTEWNDARKTSASAVADSSAIQSPIAFQTFDWDSSDTSNRSGIRTSFESALLLSPLAILTLFSLIIITWRSLARTDPTASDSQGVQSEKES